MNVPISSFPASLAEFCAMPRMDLTRPENTAAMLICALDLYCRDREAGIAAVNALRGPRPMSPFEVQFLRDRLSDKPYLPRAYCLGAAPANNYAPAAPLTVAVQEDPAPQYAPEGYKRVFLKTAGADSPRPVTLRPKDGKWYLWEYAGVLAGIRVPVEEDPWA
jgi:hypothetical protein